MINGKKFGTAPVFVTAISTILGAILFLRFGFAIGSVGFWGTILIIILGHLVTIPTALAISEIATNKRVEGGGEYFIISRSFGLNIGATIGIALFLSQAISVAFYVIAFTETFQFLFDFVREKYSLDLPRQVISIPVMVLLSMLILKRGANVGVRLLYLVVAILFVSLLMFFLGSPADGATNYLGENATFKNPSGFFIVFAIVFPAFTGMTAGVGLSGDLRNPARSIPVGTILATLAGGIGYVFVTYKLASSAGSEDLLKDQFIMGKIAVQGFIVIPMGLAASTLSSALGSIMVAPRTLQALAIDKSFPLNRLNRWLSANRVKDNEPVNASIITCIIALAFVSLGNVNAVAMVISMFFLVTYGTLCLISFLNHFGSSPSYRPSFRSKWYLSLTGFLASVWIMFKISTPYALIAAAAMVLIYIYINSYHPERKGLVSIFANTIFQLNRNLQIYLQKQSSSKTYNEWRPSAICISKSSFERNTALKLMNWISYKYGFGTYLHRIEGYYSKATYEQSRKELNDLVKSMGEKSYVYIDTIISPSYTSAIAQSIQIPGIAGMENNMVVFEYEKNDIKALEDILDNFRLVNAGNFDVCILASANKQINYRNGIHVWITSMDEENANLMVLLSFIILGHHDWRKANIKIFVICRDNEKDAVEKQMKELLSNGRLPITAKNIEILPQNRNVAAKSVINQYSAGAGLTLIGFREDSATTTKEFEGYDELGNILFVNSHNKKAIE